MENKINLAKELVENIKSRENILQKGLILPRQLSVYNYYLKENINKIFGKTEFDLDEIEIVSTKTGIEISSIFGLTLNIVLFDTEAGLIITGMVNGKDAFTISSIGGIISNISVKSNEDKLEEEQFIVNVEKEEFSYYTGSCAIGENPEYNFGATLKPMNAKYKDVEIFELTRIIPQEEKSASFLKRLVDNLKGDNYIKIETSNELVDVIDYSDEIFDRLKDESKRFGKKNSSEIKKELKKDDNE